MKPRNHGRKLRNDEMWTCVLCFPAVVKGFGEQSRLAHQREVHKLGKGHRQGMVTRRGAIRRDLFVPGERNLDS